MSVPVWKRKESKVLYLDTASKIHLESIRFVMKLPKASRFLIGTSISKTAEEVLSLCLEANDSHDIHFRKTTLELALSKLDFLEILILNALSIYSFNEPKEEDSIGDIAITKIGSLIPEEKKLIKGVLASDQKRA